jgi:hypothetical protein
VRGKLAAGPCASVHVHLDDGQMLVAQSVDEFGEVVVTA